MRQLGGERPHPQQQSIPDIMARAPSLLESRSDVWDAEHIPVRQLGHILPVHHTTIPAQAGQTEQWSQGSTGCGLVRRDAVWCKYGVVWWAVVWRGVACITRGDVLPSREMGANDGTPPHPAHSPPALPPPLHNVATSNSWAEEPSAPSTREPQYQGATVPGSHSTREPQQKCRRPPHGAPVRLTR